MNNNTLFIEKYTPKTLKDFRLDTDIDDALTTLIESDCLNVLLLGNMGTGKTNILNAIIKEYYKDIPRKNYIENILYINNLQEQGINYYRSDVKTFCQTSSSVKRKKKIVVIDDIDMISEQSQQAFRNCIDKFSHNVCFLASCTTNQKVIESIQSRLTVVRLPIITKHVLQQIFDNIIESEKIDIDENAKKFILSISNNTIKVLINYAEKCKLINNKITLEISQNICSDINLHTFETYTHHIKNGNLHEAIDIIYSVVDDGYSVMDILNNYFTFIKLSEILTEQEKYLIIPFICKYITTFHDVHENDIELPLFTNNLINTISKN